MLRKALWVIALAPLAAGRGRPADLRRAPALQPRRLGVGAARAGDRDAAQGGRQARAGLELRRRRPAAPRRAGARPDHPRAAALPLARRHRHLVPRRDGDPVPGGPAQEIPIRRDRRVPPLRRGRRPPGAAPHGAAREAVQPVPARAFRRRRGRAPVQAVAARRASSGRTPASSAPDGVRTMLRKHKNLWCRSRLPHRPRRRAARSTRNGARRSCEFPDRFMLGTDTYTPERWHYIPEHAVWSRAAGSPTCRRDVAERIALEERRGLVRVEEVMRSARRPRCVAAPRGGVRAAGRRRAENPVGTLPRALPHAARAAEESVSISSVEFARMPARPNRCASTPGCPSTSTG